MAVHTALSRVYSAGISREPVHLLNRAYGPYLRMCERVVSDVS